jgi:integrase
VSVYKLENGRWRVQVRRKGFPTLDGVCATQRDAKAREAEFIAECSSAARPADVTLSALWTRYEASHEFRAKGEHTRKTETSRIKPVLAKLGAYSLHRLEERPHLVYDYIDARAKAISPKTKRHLSPSSVRLEVAAMSSVVAWAQRRKLVLSNFLKGVTRPGQTKRKRRVPAVEQARLDMAVLHWDEPKLAEAARFAILLRRLGCRPGELAGTLRADVRMRDEEMTFRNTKYQGQDRRVPLSQEAVSLIDAQLAYALEHCTGSPYLFSTRGRKTAGMSETVWKSYAYSTAVKRLRKAGVVPADFHAHAMRREFISRAIEAGMPYATIRKMTGHHSTQAIEIYDEGLAVSADIRSALDVHQNKVSEEMMLGQMQALGLSPEQIESMLLRLKGEQPKVSSRVYANGETSR